MYNGIGLDTARGSGTNGYVTRNMAFVRKNKERVEYKGDLTEGDDIKIPNMGILAHERKRKIELKCMEMHELMEEQGYPLNEVEKKVWTFRQMLMEKEGLEDGPVTELDEFGRPLAKETHQIAEANLKKNARLREAFGLSEHYKDGSSMDPERRAKEEEAARLQRAKQEAEREANEQERHLNTIIREKSASPSPKKKKKDKSEDGKKKKHKKDKKKQSKKKRKRGEATESESEAEVVEILTSDSERETRSPRKRHHHNKHSKSAGHKSQRKEHDKSAKDGHKSQSPPVRRKKTQSPSPVRRKKTPSPVRRRDDSPVRRKDNSPVRRMDNSPVRRRQTPSPVRRMDNSPVRRRQTPSPVRRNTPPHARRSHSQSPVPIRHEQSHSPQYQSRKNDGNNNTPKHRSRSPSPGHDA